jgi:hypothetical protein
MKTPMRYLLTTLVTSLLAASVAAQSPYPAPAVPDASWGGYAVPAQVPYQPTLPADGTAFMGPPAGPVWQTYPPAVDASGQVILGGTAPMGPPIAVPNDQPADTGYSITGESDLKKSLIPMGSRDGFFQRIKFTGTWLPQLEGDSLGWTDFKTELVTALPFFTRENPIIITPSYELHFLDGPNNIALPPRLHDAVIDFHVFRVYDNHWIADFAITPGFYADDDSFDSSAALRINGRALGIYAPTVDVKWVLGVTYLDGAWNKVVPVVGVMYTPTDDVEYQIVFPTPRVAWRLASSPIPGRDERWVYIGVEYANSAWAFQQTSGAEDELAYRDFRLLLGFERKLAGGISNRFEVGYVFNRDIRVASISSNDIDMDNTFLLRAGVSY